MFVFASRGRSLFLPDRAHAATCGPIVGKWAWFIGGKVTVNPDGTFTQQSGNAGTWQCTDPARGSFTSAVARRWLCQQLSTIAGWARSHQHGSIPVVCHCTKISSGAKTSSAGSQRELLPGNLRVRNERDRSRVHEENGDLPFSRQLRAASRKLRAGKPHSLKRPTNSSACATAPRAVQSPVKHR